MLTAAKLAANRRNAQKSTGPRTPEGKARVRLNALKHGLTAKHAPITPEEAAEFDTLLADFRSDLRPTNPLEDSRVLEIATSLWHMRRLQRIEVQVFNRFRANDFRSISPLDRLSRQEARHQRSFYRALHALDHLRIQKMTNQTHCPVSTPSCPPQNKKVTNQSHALPGPNMAQALLPTQVALSVGQPVLTANRTVPFGSGPLWLTLLCQLAAGLTGLGIAAPAHGLTGRKFATTSAPQNQPGVQIESRPVPQPHPLGIRFRLVHYQQACFSPQSLPSSADKRSGLAPLLLTFIHRPEDSYMNISPTQASLASGTVDVQNSPEGPGPEQAAQNREVAKAVRAINDKEAFGPGSELRFSIDRDTGRALIRIVDRTTNEVLNQIPPEDVLRLAIVLAELRGHQRLA